ncbi:hypothetical protein [Paraburkholderia sp. BCC1885]|uniref:hypothetical protein n=1 Tax=Paraburkholderia sp. BCC1885 TaxID=2562669 RepID=UPI001184387C|nr:hypothetical protein [Paraburkholderia sp. BCC1885]
MKKNRRIAPVLRWPAALCGLTLACAAHAQEFSLLGGALRADQPGEGSYSWGFTYLQALDEYNAISYSWLNEGHLQDNHRDGLALQYWRRASFFDRRLSLAAGVGIYNFFDTIAHDDGKPYVDGHGWAPIVSITATWYTDARFFYQLRVNQVLATQSYKTTSVLFGVGYELDAPNGHGALSGATRQSVSSGDQITALAGWTEVNSLSSPGAMAESVEYRHGFGAYFDGTLSWIDEGHTPLNTRDGVAAQAWLRRSFFDDKLTLGVGAGPYFAVDTHRSPDGQDTGGRVSILLTMSAAYSLTKHWIARASWNRVMTTYDKDSDIYLGGIGYRF